MENEVVKVNQNGIKVRDIEVITAEIKDLCSQAKTMALLYVVEIGRRLKEAKEALPYGQWGDWLKNEVEFSQSTATNYMRLFDEYGSSQISIFGASVDSQTFAKLPYSKALQLLAVPTAERETFANEVGVEDLSVSQLKQAIEERNKAVREAQEAQERENALAESLAEAERAAKDATKKAEETERLRAELEKKQAEVDSAKKKAESLKKLLKTAEENPTISKETLDKIRREAQEAAKQEAETASNKELETIKNQMEAAQANEEAAKKAERQALQRLEETEKRLKTASPEVTAFKTLFDTMQDTASKCRGMIEKIRTSDPEMAEKLTKALKAFGASL